MGSSSTQIINYLLFIVLVFMFFRTFSQAKQLGNGKGFTEAYTKILSNDLDAEENLDKYMETEKKQYLLSQANLLKAYLALDKESDPKPYLDKIELKPIFCNSKGKFDAKFAVNNIAFFLWVNMFVARCLKYGRNDLIDVIASKLNEYDNELNNYMEYRLFKGIVAGTKKEKNDDYNFLKLLIAGEYPNLKYEKRYIGLYKREATIFLIYFGEQVDEFWENDLHAFVDTSVGKRLSTDLGLYDKYHVEQEVEPVPSDEEDKK